jgi:hypothetical protein
MMDISAPDPEFEDGDQFKNGDGNLITVKRRAYDIDEEQWIYYAAVVREKTPIRYKYFTELLRGVSKW